MTVTDPPVFRRSYKRYVLTTLTLVYTLSYLDQNLIILLVQPIKDDLLLSDSQVGFLTGIAFAVLYAILGLPIARWADRGNRTTIISLAIGLWAGTVMFYLLVTSFAQLVFARIAASVADSGCMPPSYSLLGDYFPAGPERARSMTIYMLGGSVASLVAFIVGGHLNVLFGWRVAMFAMGVPALLIAALVKVTISEPREPAGGPHRGELSAQRITSVIAGLWHCRSSRHLGVGITLYWMLAAGLAPWYAAFMIRSHGMSTAELGLWLGIIFGLGGIGGTLLGGYVAARWFAVDERSQMRLTAIVVACLVPCCALFLSAPAKEPGIDCANRIYRSFEFLFWPNFCPDATARAG